ncbi:MAG: hypothetical protein EZS28_018616, partial [Streblomastix strix]
RGEEIEGVDPYQDVIRFEKIQKLDVNTREILNAIPYLPESIDSNEDLNAIANNFSEALIKQVYTNNNRLEKILIDNGTIEEEDKKDNIILSESAFIWDFASAVLMSAVILNGQQYEGGINKVSNKDKHKRKVSQRGIVDDDEDQEEDDDDDDDDEQWINTVKEYSEHWFDIFLAFVLFRYPTLRSQRRSQNENQAQNEIKNIVEYCINIWYGADIASICLGKDVQTQINQNMERVSFIDRVICALVHWDVDKVINLIRSINRLYVLVHMENIFESMGLLDTKRKQHLWSLTSDSQDLHACHTIQHALQVAPYWGWNSEQCGQMQTSMGLIRYLCQREEYNNEDIDIDTDTNIQVHEGCKCVCRCFACCVSSRLLQGVTSQQHVSEGIQNILMHSGPKQPWLNLWDLCKSEIVNLIRRSRSGDAFQTVLHFTQLLKMDRKLNGCSEQGTTYCVYQHLVKDIHELLGSISSIASWDYFQNRKSALEVDKIILSLQHLSEDELGNDEEQNIIENVLQKNREKIQLQVNNHLGQIRLRDNIVSQSDIDQSSSEEQEESDSDQLNEQDGNIQDIQGQDRFRLKNKDFSSTSLLKIPSIGLLIQLREYHLVLHSLLDQTNNHHPQLLLRIPPPSCAEILAVFNLPSLVALKVQMLEQSDKDNLDQRAEVLINGFIAASTQNEPQLSTGVEQCVVAMAIADYVSVQNIQPDGTALKLLNAWERAQSSPQNKRSVHAVLPAELRESVARALLSQPVPHTSLGTDE